jgi:hypothetical protein
MANLAQGLDGLNSSDNRVHEVRHWLETSNEVNDIVNGLLVGIEEINSSELVTGYANTLFHRIQERATNSD